MAGAIRTLSGRWDLPRVDAARMIAATGAEMRDAGCSATEILTLRFGLEHHRRIVDHVLVQLNIAAASDHRVQTI